MKHIDKKNYRCAIILISTAESLWQTLNTSSPLVVYEITLIVVHNYSKGMSHLNIFTINLHCISPTEPLLCAQRRNVLRGLHFSTSSVFPKIHALAAYTLRKHLRCKNDYYFHHRCAKPPGRYFHAMQISSWTAYNNIEWEERARENVSERKEKTLCPAKAILQST